MPRTSATITQAEIDAFQKFCIEHRIITDGEAGNANGNQIGEYIAVTWGEDITPATLAVAFEKLRDRLTFYTPAQAEYKMVADQEPDRASQFNAWFTSRANTSLVTDGEEGFQNETILLAELRGRDINPKNIQDAIGRASFKSGLHFVQAPRPVDPRQHKDDGSGFLRNEKNPRYRNGRINHAYVEPGSKQETQKNLDPSEAQWRSMAESLCGNSHSKTAEIQRIHGKNWRETYELRKKALNTNPVLVNRYGAA
jgi:hypothetical protein